MAGTRRSSRLARSPATTSSAAKPKSKKAAAAPSRRRRAVVASDSDSDSSSAEESDETESESDSDLDDEEDADNKRVKQRGVSTSPRKSTSRSSSPSKQEYQTLLAKRGAGESKCRKVGIRCIAGLVMLGVYFSFFWAGHIACLAMIGGLQVMLFRELVNVRYVHAKGRKVPLFRTLQWLWFAVAMFYCYGEVMTKVSALEDVFPYHAWLTFALYCIIFVSTVLSFRKGYYRYQVGQLTWTVVIVCLVVLQVTQASSLLFDALYWYLLSSSLVMMADTSAYFCGMACGRRLISTPFLSISPNKTWEGLIGGAVCTSIFGFLHPAILRAAASSDAWYWLTCSYNDLQGQIKPYSCDLPASFHYTTYELPSMLTQSAPLLSSVLPLSLELMPVQWHTLALGAFASIVAPFGGFFASAIKRAYKLKDFDSFIPGHGGMTDRCDCQLLMILCTSIHYNTFLKNVATVGSVLASVAYLSSVDQRTVLTSLQQMLDGNAGQ